MPRVSVLIPSFNHEPFVGEAIESVLAQTLSDLELVVVDDGSSDGSRARIERYGDARIVRHFQGNRGAHAALNQALALSSAESEYVAILNSDDSYDPRWLEVAAEVLDGRPRTGFCSALLSVFGDGQPAKQDWLRGWCLQALEGYRSSGEFETSILRANFILTTSNVVFRRRLLASTGGFRALRYVHDLDFFLRLAARSEFALVEQALVHYRVHAANTIAEATRDDRRIVFEFGWILADLLDRALAEGAPLPALQERLVRLVQALPQPAVGSAALALFAQRAAARLQRGTDLLPPFEQLLEGGVDWAERLMAAELDPRRAELESLTRAYEELKRTREVELKAFDSALQTMDRDNRALNQAVQDLVAEVARLRASRTYRLGQALAETRGVSSALQLPWRLLRIARERPAVPPAQARDGEHRAG